MIQLRGSVSLCELIPRVIRYNSLQAAHPVPQSNRQRVSLNTSSPLTQRSLSWKRLAPWILALAILIPLGIYLVQRLIFNSTDEPLRLVVYGYSTQEEAFNGG